MNDCMLCKGSATEQNRLRDFKIFKDFEIFRDFEILKDWRFRDFKMIFIAYRTAGYCCEVQIFATLLKWPLAEISAIAKFARYEADFHWILCQENAWAKFYSLENIRISLFQQKFLRVEP